MMESADVLSHPERKDAALLSFKERYLAEKFINQAKEIPHIGNVELSWVANSIVPIPTPTAAPVSTGAAFSNGHNNSDVNMDEPADFAGPDVDERDYDVADDDEKWLTG